MPKPSPASLERSVPNTSRASLARSASKPSTASLARTVPKPSPPFKPAGHCCESKNKKQKIKRKSKRKRNKKTEKIKNRKTEEKKKERRKEKRKGKINRKTQTRAAQPRSYKFGSRVHLSHPRSESRYGHQQPAILSPAAHDVITFSQAQVIVSEKSEK